MKNQVEIKASTNASLCNNRNYSSNNIDPYNELSLKYKKQIGSKIIRLRKASREIKINNRITNISSKPIQNYTILCKLGKGSFGQVYKVVHNIIGVPRAMKIIPKKLLSSETKIKNYIKEIEVLKTLEHPNIVRIIEYYSDEKNYYIITEIITGGELYDSIIESSKFSEKEVKDIMRQILKGLNYLHLKGIVHRDIKPENIMCDKDENGKITNIKIIDFGMSNFFDSKTKFTHKVGSPYYIAPEVIKKNYNEKCDIWSAGVILYVLLMGCFPFEGNSISEIFSKILKGTYKKEGKQWKSISPEGRWLIEQMLKFEPEKRISATKCLQSDFFKTNSKSCEIDISQSIIGNLFNLKRREKLQQATIALIVHNLRYDSEIDEMKQLFDFIDVNSDGTLTYKEIKEAFQKLFPEMETERVKQIILEMDNNNDKVISYEEFLRAAINVEKIFHIDNLKLAFNSFDLNKDGKLDKNELIKILGVSSSEYVDTLISIIDENQDGLISFEEFCQLMKKVDNHENENENKKNDEDKKEKISAYFSLSSSSSDSEK